MSHTRNCLLQLGAQGASCICGGDVASLAGALATIVPKRLARDLVQMSTRATAPSTISPQQQQAGRGERNNKGALDIQRALSAGTTPQGPFATIQPNTPNRPRNWAGPPPADVPAAIKRRWAKMSARDRAVYLK